MTQDPEPRISMTLETNDMAAVVAALREHDRFLVASHENPDGDAIGSLLAMHLALTQLGKDSVMFLSGVERPLPAEYRFLALDAILREPPADHAERVLVAVDCAKEERIGPDPSVLERSPFTVDIDHHHDNTRFGNVNLIVPDASSTGEILADLFGELGVEITREIAEPLYTAVVTDTGRFQYANTSPKALRLAADLIEAGADWHKVFQTVYETVQFAKLKLLARQAAEALGRPPRHLCLLKEDFAPPARPSRTPRASSTTCARSRVRWWRRSSGSLRPAAARRTASRCARRWTRWTSP
jgi:phosphoesterase RecJ-like protein